MGRPTSLTPKVQRAVVDALRSGQRRPVAASLAGVSYTSMKSWLARGRVGEEPFAAFLAQVTTAEDDAESAMVALVRKAAITTWQAAAWWLERRRWREYTKREASFAKPAQVAPRSTDDLPALERELELALAAVRAKRSVESAESATKEPH